MGDASRGSGVCVGEVKGGSEEKERDKFALTRGG